MSARDCGALPRVAARSTSAAQAEEAFNRASLEERSKFETETLVNSAGRKLRRATNWAASWAPSWAQPAFGRIRSEAWVSPARPAALCDGQRHSAAVPRRT